MSERIDNTTEIALLTDKLQLIEKERHAILNRLKELRYQGVDVISNSSMLSGDFFKQLITDYLVRFPKSSKLQLAQKLKISQGRLYDLINGKRLISSTILQKMIEVMELTSEQSHTLCKLCEQDRQKKKTDRRISKATELQA